MKTSLRRLIALGAFGLCIGCVHTVVQILTAEMEPLPSTENSVEGRVQNTDTVHAPMLDPVVAGAVQVTAGDRLWSAQLGLARVRVLDAEGTVHLVEMGNPFANWYGLMSEDESHPRVDLLPGSTNDLIPIPEDAEPPFHVRAIGVRTDDVLLVERIDDRWGRIFVGGRERVARLQEQATARMHSIALMFSVGALLSLLAAVLLGRGRPALTSQQT